MKMTQSIRFKYAVNMLLLVQYNLIICNGFNVDTVNYIVHEGPPNSMFGYNVFLQKGYQRSRIIVGAPQAYTRQANVTGEIYRCQITDNNLCDVVPFDENAQSYSDMINNYKSESTVETTASESDLNSYHNYSVSSGNGYGNGKPFIAIGMPTEGAHLGKVLIFSPNMTNLLNITGEQIGANFGYSICAVDVDGDKFDDLIVGAPMHTNEDNKVKHEIGRIYILYNTNNRFYKKDTRDGFNSRGKFGLSLTTLNDIDLDGYGDFAVGAPYDGPNGRGAVYIYHGSRKGTLEKYSQVIYAEDISEKFLSSFGFALSGGMDVDGNMYPDIAVGAYESNTVVVFKSRPVVVMEASITFETESKLIQLDDRNCTLQGYGGGAVACTDLTSCLKYTGINLQPSLDFDVSWILDSKINRSTKRMFFLNDKGKEIRNTTMTLYHGKSECRKERVYIVDSIREKLTPLEIEMKFNLHPSGLLAPLWIRKPCLVPQPVLDQNNQKDSINIQNNCGTDNICIPDLRLIVKNVEEFTLASEERLVFDVEIMNYGEDAFEATFFMVFPEEWTYVKKDCIRETPRCGICSWRDATLKCDIGNPLSAGMSASFKVFTSPSSNYVPTPKYDFYMKVNTTNPEHPSSLFDNVMQKSIIINMDTVETNLSVSGIVRDAQIYYNISDYKKLQNALREADIGPQLRSIYEIKNGGPGIVNRAEFFILIPHLTFTGDHLMYILEEPETIGNVQCESSNYVNVLGLKCSGSTKQYVVSGGSMTGDATFVSRSGPSTNLKQTDLVSRSGLSTDFNQIDFKEDLTCNKTQCAIIRCVIGPLGKDKNALISIRTRLVAETIHKISPTTPMNLTIIAIARVTKLSLFGELINKPLKRHEMVFTAIPIYDVTTKK